MAFPGSSNAQSYNNMQSPHDDNLWRQRQANGGAKGGIQSAISGILGEEKQLPMYKDKPHYPPARRKGGGKKIKQLAALLSICAIAAYWLGWVPGFYEKTTGVANMDKSSSQTKSVTTPEQWRKRQAAVKEAFVTSWEGYEKYAWGFDEYHPISKQGRNMVEGGMGWMIVDALDTAIIMNLTDQVSRARLWMKTSLSYTADHDVSTFETTIRSLGGLLAAHYLSTTFPNLAPQRDDDINQPGEDLYIEKATDLAGRLLGAYDTPSGIPLASINLNTSTGIAAGDSGASSTAEAATLQLEMKYLSKLTGEPIYWQQSEKVMKVLDDQHRDGGLLPIYILPHTGMFMGDNIRLGSRGDSYYEYLIKQYLQTGGAESAYREMWEESLEGIKKYLITYTRTEGLTVLAERQNGLKSELTAKMDHLVCFMPGTIALAITGGATVEQAKKKMGSAWGPKQEEDLHLAQELMKTCWGMYKVTATGLAPEITYFNVDSPPKRYTPKTTAQSPLVDFDESEDAAWRSDYNIHSQDTHNLQRPETIESLFYMYRITRNPIYREWGWKIFTAFVDHTRVLDENTGEIYSYTSLQSVMQAPVPEHGGRRDNMESFWLAETLKYLYLLFSDESFFDLEKIVINTEAHIFPRFDISGSKVWKTGWSRSKPEPEGTLSVAAAAVAAAVPESVAVGIGIGTGTGEEQSPTKEKDINKPRFKHDGVGQGIWEGRVASERESGQAVGYHKQPERQEKYAGRVWEFSKPAEPAKAPEPEEQKKIEEVPPPTQPKEEEKIVTRRSLVPEPDNVLVDPHFKPSPHSSFQGEDLDGTEPDLNSHPRDDEEQISLTNSKDDNDNNNENDSGNENTNADDPNGRLLALHKEQEENKKRWRQKAGTQLTDDFNDGTIEAKDEDDDDDDEDPYDEIGAVFDDEVDPAIMFVY